MCEKCEVCVKCVVLCVCCTGVCEMCGMCMCVKCVVRVCIARVWCKHDTKTNARTCTVEAIYPSHEPIESHLFQLEGPIRTCMQGNGKSLNRFDNKAAIAMWLHGKSVSGIAIGTERPGNRRADQSKVLPLPVSEGGDERESGGDDKKNQKVVPVGGESVSKVRKLSKRDPKPSLSKSPRNDSEDLVLKAVQRHIESLDQRLDTFLDKANKTMASKSSAEKLVDQVSAQLASHDTKIGNLSQSIDKLSTKLGTLETAVRSLADAVGRGDVLPKQHCTRQSGVLPDPIGIPSNPPAKKATSEKSTKTDKRSNTPSKAKGGDAEDVHKAKPSPKRKTQKKPPPQPCSESSDTDAGDDSERSLPQGDEEPTPKKSRQIPQVDLDKHASPPSTNQANYWRPPFPTHYPMPRFEPYYDNRGRKMGESGQAPYHGYDYAFQPNLPSRTPPVHEMFAQFMEAQAQAQAQAQAAQTHARAFPGPPYDFEEPESGEPRSGKGKRQDAERKKK